MASQSVIWTLNDNVPICHLSKELADRLIASGAYDTTTCPNHIFETVGMKPSGANIIIQNKHRDELRDGGGNNIVVDVFSEGKQVDQIFIYKLFVTKVYEIAKHKNSLLDEDLLVVELHDVRSQWHKSPFLTFTAEDRFDDVVEHIGTNYLPTVTSFAYYGHFKPEKNTAHKQAMPMSGRADKLFEEALNRQESYCYIDHLGELNTKHFPEFSSSDSIEGYFNCASLTRSLGEYEVTKINNEAESISVNFYTSPGTLNFNEFLLPYPNNNRVEEGTTVSVFPLTAPISSSLSESDSYALIAERYQTEVKFSDSCEEFVIVLPFLASQVNITTEYDSSEIIIVLGRDLTTYSVTSNPYGVSTQFVRKRRHGIERYCLKTDKDETEGLIVVQGYCLSAVTTATEEFSIAVTGQNVGDDFIGEEVNVINPLNNQNSTERGYELKVSDYVTALSWEGQDGNGNTNFLCIDGPCSSSQEETAHPPTGLTLSNNTVIENQPGVDIGYFTVTDEDLPNDSHTIEIVGDDGGMEIYETNKLRVKTNAGLDSANSPILIEVLVTDDGGRVYQEGFEIEVTAEPSSDGRFALDSVQITVSGTQITGIQTASFYVNDENSIPNNFLWRVTSGQKMASGDTVTFTVKNYGSGNLTLSDVSVSGDLYSSVNKSSSVIAAGASDTFIVTCLSSVSPVENIPYAGQIVFIHNGDEFGMDSPFTYNMTHWGQMDPVVTTLAGSAFSVNQNGSGGTSVESIDGTALEGTVKEFTESSGESAGYISLSGLEDGGTYDVYIRYRVSASGTQGYKFTNSTSYAAGGWTTLSDMPTTFAGLGDTYGGDAFEKVLTGYSHSSSNNPYLWMTSGTNISQSVYIDRVVFVQTS